MLRVSQSKLKLYENQTKMISKLQDSLAKTNTYFSAVEGDNCKELVNAEELLLYCSRVLESHSPVMVTTQKRNDKRLINDDSVQSLFNDSLL